MTTYQQFLTIGQAAQYLGVSRMTLRRWHRAGTFLATFVSPGRRLYYTMADLQQKTKGLVQSALDWADAAEPLEPIDAWYCPTSDVFKARLERMTGDLLRRPARSELAPLIVSAAGEIGNNSYDHNLGNWPDVPGTLFAYDLGKRTVVLADRGVGILATLRRVRPELRTHREALHVAFTEIITGRAAEHRGNGLKYVRSALSKAQAMLTFWSGDACVRVEQGGTLRVLSSRISLRGCVAVIRF